MTVAMDSMSVLIKFEIYGRLPDKYHFHNIIDVRCLNDDAGNHCIYVSYNSTRDDRIIEKITIPCSARVHMYTLVGSTVVDTAIFTNE
jgi:hypothetical protein